MANQDLSQFIDGEIIDDIIENTCRDCKGWLHQQAGATCWETCDGTQTAFAIEILGLTEYWDGLLPAPAKESIPVEKFLRKLAEAKIQMRVEQEAALGGEGKKEKDARNTV